MPNEAVQLVAYARTCRLAGSLKEELALMIALGSLQEVRRRLRAISSASPIEDVAVAADMWNRLGEHARVRRLTNSFKDGWYVPVLQARAEALVNLRDYEGAFELVVRLQAVERNLAGVEELERRLLKKVPSLREQRQRLAERARSMLSGRALVAARSAPVSNVLRSSGPRDPVLGSDPDLVLQRVLDE